MKVDPEQLEREAEELQKQLMEQNAEPQPEVEEETLPVPEDEENPPAESADTGEDGEEQAPSDEDRGDPDHDDGDDTDLKRQLKIAEERVKNAQARMTKATQEAAELRRNVAVLQQTVADLQSQLAGAATRQDEVDEELSRLSEEYPDIAQPLLKKLSRLEETVTQYRTQMATDQSQATLQVHFDTIRKSHPDMDDVVVSDDFTGWLERQSQLWQRVASEGSATEVVELLDRYKEAIGAAPQQPESKVDKARRVAEPSLPKARKPDPSSGKRIWTRDEIRRMSLSDFEKHQASIDQAYLEGRVR
jgi:chromosome segregation ATPase